MNWLQRTFEISHSGHRAMLSMEGLRGLAVFLVFLVHYVTLIDPWISRESVTYQTAIHLITVGNSGVDLFFVLSGYLIYGTLIRKRKPFLPYLVRRVQRIYPTFICVFVIYLVLSFVFPSESKLPDKVADMVVYILQNILLLPGLVDIDPIITVAWSLSYEFFYYLSIPMLIGVLSMRSWSPRSRVIFFSLLSLLGFAYFYSYTGPIRLLMFLAGIVLYEVVNREVKTKIPNIGLVSLGLAMVSMIVVRELDIGGWWRFVALYVFFFVLCLECFTSQSDTVRIFTLALLRWYGNMSYSYYLIHGLALKAAFLVLGKIYPPTGDDITLFWVLLPPMLFITLIPSTILFVLVEKPYSLRSARPSREGISD